MRWGSALRWSCYAAVAIWSLAIFSQASLGPAPARQPAPTARVRPVVEKPPRPQPAPQPDPPAEEPSVQEPEASPARSAPPARRVGQAELAEGTALLDGAGDFPALSCSYEDFAGFRGYARAMAGLGARLVVVRDREIVSTIDLDTGAFDAASLGPGFSPRARGYTGEPGLAPLARTVRERFGGRAVVMMLVPRDLDAGLFGGLARLLAEHGERRERVREIRGRYQPGPGGGVWLRVEAAVRGDGSTVSMDALFDLGQIAAAVRA
ncbi:MAG: hypothetical protein JRS35_00630 [Deltaproteobacteria bacterium]|nr:hypothetical protein [Deltaproteobacteria bacterium]